MSSPDFLAPALSPLYAAVSHLAQTTLPATVPSTGTGGAPVPAWMEALKSFGPLVLIVIVFYFVIFGSKRKQDNARKDMLANLKRNDRIKTIGGIRGTVVEVRPEEDEVVVKVDEGTNTKIRFARSAINEVLVDGKAEAKK